jgi:hypothetical protein
MTETGVVPLDLRGTTRRGAAAIASLTLLLLALGAANAHAYAAAASATCGSVTITWTGFPSSGAANAPTWRVVFTPAAGSPTTQDGSASFSGGSWSMSIGLPDVNGSADVSTSWTAAQKRDGDSGSFTAVRTIANCRAAPTIATVASADVPVGSAIYGTAALSGATAPTGTIRFSLYAASDTACSVALATRARTVAGNGTYPSASLTPAHAGSYRWVASYSGDAFNAPAYGTCSTPAGQVVVSKLAPAMATTASGEVVSGGAVRDTAVLSGGRSLTGTMTFSLYAAGDARCVTALHEVATAVDGAGTYVSADVTPATAGTYQWVAAYSGDVDNEPVAGRCDEPSAQVVVTGPPVDDRDPVVVADPPIGLPAPAVVGARPGKQVVAGIQLQSPPCTAPRKRLGGLARVMRAPAAVVFVTAGGVRRVTYYIDGRPRAIVARPERGRFAYAIPTARLALGLHRLTAKVHMRSSFCDVQRLSGMFIRGKAA